MLDAPFLLRRYDALTLLGEHLQWEALALNAPHYNAVRHNSQGKTIIVLDGIPGAGKSTTRRWLAPAVGAGFFSMARFAEARGVTSDERSQHQLATHEPHAVDAAFLDALAACPARYLLLEKFPRSSVEAAALLQRAHELRWTLEVLHLDLPGDCIELSVARQRARGPRQGRIPDHEHAQRRALAHTARTTSARNVLRAHGVPIHRFDMTRPAPDVRAEIRQALRLEPAALRWHLPTLEVLESVSGALGIEAFLANGSLYRPFFNDRFGPMQLPTDADVAVNHDWEVAPLLAALTRAAPHEPWSVLCPASRLREQLGVEVKSVAEAKALATFMHKTGVVRRYRGEIELILPPGAEAALWNGLLQLNPVLLACLSDQQRLGLLARYAERLPTVLAKYPGLTVDPSTARLLNMPAGDSQVVDSGFAPLKSRALAEAQPKRVAQCRRKLTEPELMVAREIVAFHRHSPRESSPPLRPRKPSQPLTPAGLVSLARDADDQTFGTWLLDQQRHNPEGGPDPDLRVLQSLDFAPPSQRGSRVTTKALGPLHQGWTLERHLIESALQLETDNLVAALRTPDLRLCLRVAMLYHDIGKLFGSRPARHPQISARLFAKHRPADFPVSLVPLTQWMIRFHDLFGAFTRALTDKIGHAAADYDVDPDAPSSYYGALDAQAARARLRDSGRPFAEAAALAKALWRADVGAIATLRWLQPVAELVEQLLLLQAASTFAGVERRAG